MLHNARTVIRRQKCRITSLKVVMERNLNKETNLRKTQLPHSTTLAEAKHKLTATTYGYISDLLRNALRKRPTCSVHSIRLATGCYHYSPRTARYWHNIGLRLPSRSTVRKYVGKCFQKPGPCHKLLSSLKQMAPGLTESQ